MKSKLSISDFEGCYSYLKNGYQEQIRWIEAFRKKNDKRRVLSIFYISDENYIRANLSWNGSNFLDFSIFSKGDDIFLSLERHDNILITEAEETSLSFANRLPNELKKQEKEKKKLAEITTNLNNKGKGFATRRTKDLIYLINNRVKFNKNKSDDALKKGVESSQISNTFADCCRSRNFRAVIGTYEK